MSVRQAFPNDPQSGGRAQRFWGKYRGKVLNNIDPLAQGRIQAQVPAISGSLLNWALPCAPYAGSNVGFYAIPPCGANVWIEFEGGDPDYPIWSGAFWGPEDVLHVPEPVAPELKVFKTAYTTLVINDAPEVGGLRLTCSPPAVDVPITITLNSEGVTINCPEATVKMTPGSITLTVPESSIEITPASITLGVPETVVELTPEMASIAVPASSIEITGEAIEIEGVSVSIDGEVNIAPVLTVEGESNLLGALTVEGETNIAGALTVEGAVDIAGGLAIEGGGTIDGAPIL